MWKSSSTSIKVQGEQNAYSNSEGGRNSYDWK